MVGSVRAWRGDRSKEEVTMKHRIGALLPVGAGDQSHHRGARRRSRRFPLNAEIVVREPREARGVALNASAGGIRILVDQELEVESVCCLEVHYAAERCSIEHARVVWCRALADGWVVGLEFTDITWRIPPDGDELRAA
jgi:hypothetical protein